jgi:Domain of unknown function (DUF4278)
VTQDVFGMFFESGIFTIKTVKQVDRLQLKQQDIYWEKKMKLSYRGISYDRNPSELVARRPFQSLRSSRASYNLIYRGATYTVDSSAKRMDFPTKYTSPQKRVGNRGRYFL